MSSESIWSVTPICSNNSLAATPHGVDQSVHDQPGDVVPGLKNCLLQLSSRHRSWLNSVELNLKSIPIMFNRVKIWTQRGPHHQLNIVLYEDILGDSCRVRSGIVVLENGVFASLEKKAQYEGAPPDR